MYVLIELLNLLIVKITGPVTKDTANPLNRWKLEVKYKELTQWRENLCKRVKIGFGLLLIGSKSGASLLANCVA